MSPKTKVIMLEVAEGQLAAVKQSPYWPLSCAHPGSSHKSVVEDLFARLADSYQKSLEDFWEREVARLKAA